MFIKKKVCFKRFISLSVALFLAFTSNFVLEPNSAKAASSYYVAATGSDSNNGTSLSTPFKTIQKAASVAGAGDTVYIRGGTYRETVTPANSGTAGNPITYQAYQNEDVVVSGLNVVDTSWTKYSGNIFYTGYSMTLGDRNAVFVDGNCMTYARWPNKTGANQMTNDGAAVDSGSMTSITDADMPNQASGWYNGAIVWCIAAAKWSAWGTTVTSSGGGTIHFTIPGSGGMHDAHDPGDMSRGDKNYYYLAGKLGLLDAANEWFYDSAAGRLYLYAPGGVNPGNATVEVKARDQAFNLTDKSYISIKNINIKGAALKITGNNNVVDGMNATYIFSHNANGMLASCPVTDNGIHITGSNNIIRNCNIGYSDGNLLLIDAGANNLIQNNYLHHADLTGSYDAPIRLENSYNDRNPTTVIYNTIYSTGRSAIHFNRPAYFKYNDIYNTNIVCDDGAPVYCVSDLLNSEIAYNKIHDIYWQSGTRKGVVPAIYMDGGSYNAIAYNNLMYNIGQDGVFRFNGKSSGRYGYNNTSYNCPAIYDAHDADATGEYTLDNNFHNQSAGNFVNAAGGDFHLVAGSGAVNTGNVHSPWTDGYAGSAPDKGCFEYGGTDWTAGVTSSTVTPPPTPTSTPTPTPTPTATPEVTYIVNEDFPPTSAGWTLDTDYVQNGQLILNEGNTAKDAFADTTGNHIVAEYKYTLGSDVPNGSWQIPTLGDSTLGFGNEAVQGMIYNNSFIFYNGSSQVILPGVTPIANSAYFGRISMNFATHTYSVYLKNLTDGSSGTLTGLAFKNAASNKINEASFYIGGGTSTAALDYFRVYNGNDGMTQVPPAYFINEEFTPIASSGWTLNTDHVKDGQLILNGGKTAIDAFADITGTNVVAEYSLMLGGDVPNGSWQIPTIGDSALGYGNEAVQGMIYNNTFIFFNGSNQAIMTGVAPIANSTYFGRITMNFSTHTYSAYLKNLTNGSSCTLTGLAFKNAASNKINEASFYIGESASTAALDYFRVYDGTNGLNQIPPVVTYDVNEDFPPTSANWTLNTNTIQNGQLILNEGVLAKVRFSDISGNNVVAELKYTLGSDVPVTSWIMPLMEDSAVGGGNEAIQGMIYNTGFTFANTTVNGVTASPNTSYFIRITMNFTTHTYNVFVKNLSSGSCGTLVGLPFKNAANNKINEAQFNIGGGTSTASLDYFRLYNGDNVLTQIP